MKLELSKINLFKKKDKDAVNFIPNFTRDWKFIVISFFVLTLVIFVLHFLFYWWIENYLASQLSVEVGEREANKLLDHGAYEDALSDIKEKQEKFSEYLNSAPQLVDPSL